MKQGSVFPVSVIPKVAEYEVSCIQVHKCIFRMKTFRGTEIEWFTMAGK